MRIKNNNILWRYQAPFALARVLKGPQGGGGSNQSQITILLDARINRSPPPKKNNLEGMGEKIYLFKFLFLKNGVNK
jgi:hypothetical protein